MSDTKRPTSPAKRPTSHVMRTRREVGSRLHLYRETIRALGDGDLKGVAGGGYSENRLCLSIQHHCPISNQGGCM